jgi:tetratricopeptide (TPR) repeat protein
MLNPLRLAVALTLISGLFAVAHGDNKKLMREHFERGSAFYDLGKYRDAVVEYEEAYKAKPDPALLFNIAQCYRLAREPESALRIYRSYLRRVPDAPNREEVEQYIQALQAQIDEPTSHPPGWRPLPAGPLTPTNPAAPNPAAPNPAAPNPAAPNPAAPNPAAPTAAAPAPALPGAGPATVVAPPSSAPPPSAPASAPTAPARATLATVAAGPSVSSAPASKPVYKRAWFWGVLAAVVAVGAGVGVGLALGLPKDVATPPGAYPVRF